MTRTIMARLAAALLAVAMAAPAAAQGSPPPPPPRPEAGPDAGHAGVPGIGRMRGALDALSPEGRAIVRAAMRDSYDPAARAAIEAARARVLQLIAAEPLDLRALERAMADEGAAVQRHNKRRQERFLAALQRLSAADRKALAEAGLRARERFEERRAALAERRRGLREPAPPPPPPAP